MATNDMLYHRAGLTWRKSSMTGNAGGDNCVEIAVDDGSVLVRDSKGNAREILVFARGGWRFFVAGLVRLDAAGRWRLEE